MQEQLREINQQVAQSASLISDQISNIGKRIYCNDSFAPKSEMNELEEEKYPDSISSKEDDCGMFPRRPCPSENGDQYSVTDSNLQLFFFNENPRSSSNNHLSMSSNNKRLADFGPNVQQKLSFSNINSLFIHDDNKSNSSNISVNASCKHVNRELLLTDKGQDYWTDLLQYYPDRTEEI